MGTPRDYRLTFTGAGTQEVQARGRFLRVLDAPSSSIFIQPSHGSELERRAGQSINVERPFHRIRVRSTVAQTVRIQVADTRQDDDQETVNVNATATITPGNTLPTGGDVSIPALTSATVAAGDANQLAVSITNISNQELRIGGVGVGAASGEPLVPGEKKTIATTAAVACYNPHATEAKSVAVLPLRNV